MRAAEYVIELQAHNGTAVIDLYASTHGYTSRPTDTPANQSYPGHVIDPGAFSASLFGGGRTIGDPEVGYGEIVLANADGALDAWTEYAFDGRPFRVRRLVSPKAPLATSTVVMSGTIEGIDTTAAKTELKLRIYDRLRVLDKPLQTNRYAGTTLSGGATADGTTDLKDQPKPLVFGKVFNIAAVPVNPFDLIYQVSDGAVSSIVAYDGGAPLEHAADYATLSALQAASILPGEYGTCLALGLFRLGWSPVLEITADVAVGATLADRTVADVALQILGRMDLDSDDVDYDSFDALEDVAPFECGVFVDSDETALSVLGKVLASAGAAIVPDALGVFGAVRVDIPSSPIATLTPDDLLPDGGDMFGFALNPDTDGGVPAWRVIHRYKRVGQTMTADQTAQCVDADTRTYLSKEYREVMAEDETIKVRSLLADELTIETWLCSLADATAEGARKLAMYGVDRFLLSVTVPERAALGWQRGDVITVVAPVNPFEGGRDMMILGRADALASNRVTLTMWG